MMTSCARKKFPGLESLSFELYLHMPALFGDLLVNVYRTWQQNGEIHSAVSHGVVGQLIMNSHKESQIDNFRPRTLLKAY